MKIVSSKIMAKMESLACQKGSSEMEFMEEAGSGVALIIHDYVEQNNLERVVILLCGKGNNAGDAYVAGINLLQLDYEVYAILAEPIETSSHLCQINHTRFLHAGGNLIKMPFEWPAFGLIVDGLFGTGFHGVVKEPYASIIQRANSSGLPIIAIDIPSGLHGETGHTEGDVIMATETAFLELPKTGFFLQQGWNYVGQIRHVSFGLPKEYVDNCPSELSLFTEDAAKSMLPPIKRNRHKYERGFVVGLAGSKNMSGAAILSSTAALRGGAGIMKLLYPEGMEASLSAAPSEIIKIPYRHDSAEELAVFMNKASATFIGPGVGLGPYTHELICNILPQLQKPTVIDADALTILADSNISLPQHTILTPHTGEMMRLLKMTSKPSLSMEFLQLCQDYSETKQVTLILKGAPSFIFHPGTPITVNPSGDPGMATAGSGDVLTGLIAALLAQGLSCHNAARLGVFLHGLAGEYAAEELTSYGVLASDIIFHFPEAFRFYKI